MNDISISSISANLGLAGLLTDQTLTLTTEYGLNFVAALITVIIGIWASRQLSGLLRNWLTGSSRIDQTLTPILAALLAPELCHRTPRHEPSISTGPASANLCRAGCGILPAATSPVVGFWRVPALILAAFARYSAAP